MRIALDAMGTDNAPAAELEGVALALEEWKDLEVVLVGKPGIIDTETVKGYSGRLEVVPAEEVVGMHESPTEVVKRKRGSSMAVCMDLMKQGKVSGVVSAGNTGAIMAFAMTMLGVVPGVYRPTLAGLFPTLKGSTLVLDIGANVDTKPLQLVQFGMMGTTAASYLFKKANPSVGLLNIGQEDSKGNELTFSAYQLFKQHDMNFAGNVEGNAILKGTVDVVVCDGFVGNALLKYAEGLAEVLTGLLEQYLEPDSEHRTRRWRRWLSKPVLREFIERMDYQEHGGALMLGVLGTVVVGHGRSSPRAIMNALHSAATAAGDNLVEHIRHRFAPTTQAA
ncbi:phosphate acyltransferase PlsX [candidate division WOR-3 bacterium]|uniref:Phosphate acyltransferase n=1 Tax=candidate division WOR-3 bacterium TaxID=2052148 RepID=A0A937XJQ3_UNCW3|nr:phosphate acyltransferase PlsX [candidate division WOR-3 bacterium]